MASMARQFPAAERETFLDNKPATAYPAILEPLAGVMGIKPVKDTRRWRAEDRTPAADFSPLLAEVNSIPAAILLQLSRAVHSISLAASLVLPRGIEHKLFTTDRSFGL